MGAERAFSSEPCLGLRHSTAHRFSAESRNGSGRRHSRCQRYLNLWAGANFRLNRVCCRGVALRCHLFGWATHCDAAERTEPHESFRGLFFFFFFFFHSSLFSLCVVTENYNVGSAPRRAPREDTLVGCLLVLGCIPILESFRLLSSTT